MYVRVYIVEEVAQLLRQNPQGEHPQFPRFYWKKEVANGETQLGYWEWVSHCVENRQLKESKPA